MPSLAGPGATTTPFEALLSMRSDSPGAMVRRLQIPRPPPRARRTWPR